MRTKVIASLVAGGLLVGAGFVTTIVSSPSTAAAQEDPAGIEDVGLLGRGLAFLGEVLDELVGEGTISPEDADAVLTAVEEKADEMSAEHEELMAQVREALADGVITADELGRIPTDNPFGDDRFADALADGELTADELRGLIPHPRRDAFGNGTRLEFALGDGGIDQAEFDSLDESHPLKQIEGIEELFEDDGVITFAELFGLKDQLFGR